MGGNYEGAMPTCAGTSHALGLTNELFVLGDSVMLTVLRAGLP